MAARAVIAAAEDRGQQAAAPDRQRIPWLALVLALALAVGLGWLAWPLARAHVTAELTDEPAPEEPAAEPLPTP